MSFYKNAFMHTMLPMKDVMGWIYLISLIIGVSIFLALFTVHQRRGTWKNLVWCMVLLGVVAAVFPRAAASRRDPLFLLAGVFLCLILIREINGVKKKGDEELETEN